MPEVLEELLQDVQHDRSIRSVAIWEELSPSLVGAFSSLQPRDVGQGLASGFFDQYAQFRKTRSSRKFSVAVAVTLAPQRHMAEPELADRTTMNDECGDGVGRGSERSLVYSITTEPVRDLEHLPEGVSYVHTGCVDA
jgi:hypothetical protein